jgi:tyrosine-protein phosphatase YwqE
MGAILHVDMHSHFIPGIDDGAATMEDTIALLQAMQDLGYRKVITTPHVMSDYYKNTPEIILGGLEKVREAAKHHGLTLEVEAAAEYNLDADFEEKINKKELLTFGGNHVLIEMPFMQEPPNVKDMVFKLIMAGYRPVMAHVERYPFWHQQYEKITEMRERGALLQLNINSLSGYYGPVVKKVAERLIDDEVIDLVGSDCHHLNHVQLMRQCLTESSLHKLLAQKQLKNTQL